MNSLIKVDLKNSEIVYWINFYAYNLLYLNRTPYFLCAYMGACECYCMCLSF